MKSGGKLFRFSEAISIMGSTASVSMQLTLDMLITRTKAMSLRQNPLHAIFLMIMLNLSDEYMLNPSFFVGWLVGFAVNDSA